MNMLKQHCLMLLLTLFVPFTVFADCQETLKQTPDIIKTFEKYYESGQYEKEISKKVMDAKAYLDRRLQQNSNEKFAMVLDIDETAVSNYQGLKEHHFSTNMEAFAAHYIHAKLPPIGPILGLYQYAKRRGVDVFFITSRPRVPEIISATVLNLKQAGYKDWKELYLMPIEDASVSSFEFKRDARREIEAKGYTIVLNIGDQETDLHGGYAEVAVKLPNPFYHNKPQKNMFG